MKPLTLEETRLKEEMKERCLAKGQYIDEKAKDKFKMLCHLEDFEIQYWELQQENQKLNGAIQTYDILLKANVEENKKIKKQLEEYKLQNVSLRADIMIKKMALPNELIKDKTFYDLYDMPTYEELLAQQKEFIKYLEDDLKENYRDIGYRHNIFREILDKYEEIIGDIDDKI